MNHLLRVAASAISSGIRRQSKKLGVTWEFEFVRADGGQLRQITALADDGVLRPIVGRVFSFDQTASAVAFLSGGGFHGKAVISIQ